MRLGTLSIIALLFGHPVLANPVCEDLWFARNVIYDAHGYCFGSPLGKATFDNKGCTTVDPQLPADLADRIAKNWARYNSLKCDVDQSKDRLPVYNRETRAKILAQPLAAEFGDVCSKYSGQETVLLMAPKEGAEAVGAFGPDDMLGFLHESEDDWNFITVLRSANGTPVSGWALGLPTQCGS